MKTKQHDIKKPVGHWRNQRGNQKIPWNKLKCKHNASKSTECRKSSLKREVYGDTGLHQETRRVSNKQLY